MKNLILVAVLLLVGTTYGQNYNFPIGLFSYDSLVDEVEAGQVITKQVGVDYTTLTQPNVSKRISRSSSAGLYGYGSLSGLKSLNADRDFVKNAKSKEQVYAETLRADNEASRENIVIRKAKTEILVRYNGEYSSIKLIDRKGAEVKANFSKKYRGLIVPRAKKEQNLYLEIKNDEKAKTYYHQVNL